MSKIVNIYSVDKKIIAQVNLETSSIQIDRNNQTQETLPQTYAVHFLMKNFGSEIVKNAIIKLNGLSNLSLLIARQVVSQQGDMGNMQSLSQDHEQFTDDDYVSFLTTIFLAGENL
jgi:hypothetical protein